ncbi:hypothetical protein ACPA9J_02375 [Pseudomonas aeruginosa]
MTCLAAHRRYRQHRAGVATAIFLRRPGRAVLDVVHRADGNNSSSQVVLAVHYREKEMKAQRTRPAVRCIVAIKNGLGKRWPWLGAAFALFGGLAPASVSATWSRSPAWPMPCSFARARLGSSDRHHARHRAGDPRFRRIGKVAGSPGAPSCAVGYIRRLGDRPGGPCRGDSSARSN